MRPPSGGYQELSSEVFSQTATHMAPLHSGPPLRPDRITAQGLALALPLVQLQMPLLSNEFQWQSRTMMSQHILNARQQRRNRVRTIQRHIGPPWQEADNIYETYSRDEPSRQRLGMPTESLVHSIAEIRNRSSISLPSSEHCNNTTVNETQGTNQNQFQTDTSNLDRKCVKDKVDSSRPKRAKDMEIGLQNNTDETFQGNAVKMLHVPSKYSSVTMSAWRRSETIVKQAQQHKIPNERQMCCLDCGFLPIQPVTGQCGHTRCTKCINSNGGCPCGGTAPESLHVNTLVQHIIGKMLRHYEGLRLKYSLPAGLRCPREPYMILPESQASLQGKLVDASGRQRPKTSSMRTGAKSQRVDIQVTMSHQARYRMACKLVSLGRHAQAAPLLAHVATSTSKNASNARKLLAKVVAFLSSRKRGRYNVRNLFREVHDLAACAWLKSSDLECILCCGTLMEPVTTPCGHTYCRTCIERAMDYKKTCALCQRSLENFQLTETKDTTFLKAALSSINMLTTPKPLEPDVIHIFICTVSYPSISCPLFIFDPRYWMMVRRVLVSGSRRFGMVTQDEERSYGEYGTMLEIRDCVSLENGSSILSTMGVSRFRVLKRDVLYGCEVAKIQQLVDIPPTDSLITWELRITSIQICYKALVWVNNMDKAMFQEIVATFGNMPTLDYAHGNWWESADGPTWLWWLIAILPLKPEIKLLILSTRNLLKRMTAVYRTLEAMDFVNLSSSTGEIDLRRALSSTEAWLQRSA